MASAKANGVNEVMQMSLGVIAKSVTNRPIEHLRTMGAALCVHDLILALLR